MSAPGRRPQGHVSHADLQRLRDREVTEETRVRAGRYVARVAGLAGWPAELVAVTLDQLGLAPDMGERPEERAAEGA